MSHYGEGGVLAPRLKQELNQVTDLLLAHHQVWESAWLGLQEREGFSHEDGKEKEEDWGEAGGNRVAEGQGAEDDC